MKSHTGAYSKRNHLHVYERMNLRPFINDYDSMIPRTYGVCYIEPGDIGENSYLRKTKKTKIKKNYTIFKVHFI